MTGVMSENGVFSPRELTLATIREQAAAINRALRDKAVTLDLSHLAHVDVSGIQLLISICITATKYNNKIEIIKNNTNLYNEFNRCGIQNINLICCNSKEI